MTERLKEAFEQASRLAPEEQDALADWLLEELSADVQWTDRLARSQPALRRLAQEALAEHRAGKTQPLDPDRL